MLGIDISREGFEWVLDQAVLSTFHPEIHGTPDHWKKLLHESPVRIQWDPERDWKIQIIDDVRAIQIGLSGEAVRRYVDDWIIHIEDVTPLAHEVAIPDVSSKVTKQVTNQYSVWDRENLANTAYNMIKARPLFGFGLQTHPLRNRAWLGGARF